MQHDTDSETIDESRIIQLEGAVNVRDLGGLPTTDGRTIRRGCIFRSDLLNRLTADDAIAIRSLGIRTVIDLRSRREVEHYPVSPLITSGLQHINIPIVVDPPIDADTLLEDYLLLLRHVREGLRDFFSLLAQDRFPVLMNCFAGKDRTGIVSALILGALGVPNDVIVADHMISDRNMLRHLNLHRASDTPAHVHPLPAWLVTPPATMEQTLKFIADGWGSVKGYLEAIGVAAHELDRLREALVETPTS